MDWEKAIQGEILASLCQREVINLEHIRNLGSHVSKVRSLILDVWSQINIQTLENIGNTKANAYWERNMGPGIKPGPKSSREAKVNFIKSKYCLKSFCTFDYVDPGEETVG